TMKREYSRAFAPDFVWYAPWDDRPLRPARNSYDFTYNDLVVKYIEDAGLRPHGHALVNADWPPGSNSMLPAWLTPGTGAAARQHQHAAGLADAGHVDARRAHRDPARACVDRRRALPRPREIVDGRQRA